MAYVSSRNLYKVNLWWRPYSNLYQRRQCEFGTWICDELASCGTGHTWAKLKTKKKNENAKCVWRKINDCFVRACWGNKHELVYRKYQGKHFSTSLAIHQMYSGFRWLRAARARTYNFVKFSFLHFTHHRRSCPVLRLFLFRFLIFFFLRSFLMSCIFISGTDHNLNENECLPLPISWKFQILNESRQFSLWVSGVFFSYWK